MKTKQVLAIVFFCVALLIVSSWLALCSTDQFMKLGSKGIPNSAIKDYPKAIRFFYKDFPNVSTILCYILFTLAAFLTFKEKKAILLLVNITSLAMIVWLLFLLS